MARLNLYLPEELAAKVRRRAREKGVSVSAFLSELVRSQISDEWLPGFFENVAGGWVGEPLARPDPLVPENRDAVSIHRVKSKSPTPGRE